MSNLEIKQEENVMTAGPKPTAKKYRLKIADLGYLGYKKNKDDYMSIVNKDEAQILYKSSKSIIDPEYYTYAFYPNGPKEHGLRVDFKFDLGRRIFGNKHDTLAVSWAVKEDKFVAIFKNNPLYNGARLGHDDKGQLIAAANGGYIVELEEIK